MPDEYRGTLFTTLPTAITPRISLLRSSGTVPLVIHASAELTQITGGVPESHRESVQSDTAIPFSHLEYRWDFGDPSSTETLTDPRTGEVVNSNDCWRGPLAEHVYRTAGTYTITLTAIAMDTSGRTISASTTTATIDQIQCVYLPANTQGTFTITYSGQTTGAFTAGSYNTTPKSTSSDDILAGVAALSNVGADNVRMPSSAEWGSNGSLYAFQFCRALGGASRTMLTVDATSLTGATTPRATVYERRAGSSVSTITATAEVATQYFDLTGGNDANPGTEAEPKKTVAAMTTWLSGATGRRALLKRGSSETLSNYATMNSWTSGRINAYGSGAKPVIQYGANVLRATLAHASGSTYNDLVPMRDIVIENVDIRNTNWTLPAPYTDNGTVSFGTGSTGTAANPIQAFEHLSFLNCDFQGSIGITSEASVSIGQSMRNCNVEVYRGIPGTRHDIVGLSWIGGYTLPREGNATYDHHIYDKIGNASLYAFIDFRNVAASSVAYCLNLNTLDIQHTARAVYIWRCYMKSLHGVDFSAKANTYIGTYGAFAECRISDCWIVPGNSPAHLFPGFGITNHESADITIEDTRFWPGVNGMSGKVLESFRVYSRAYISRCEVHQGTTLLTNNLIGWQNGNNNGQPTGTGGLLYMADTVIVMRGTQAARAIVNWGVLGNHPDANFKRTTWYTPEKDSYYSTTFAGAVAAGRIDSTNVRTSSEPYTDSLNGNFRPKAHLRVGSLIIPKRARLGI
jgi:hypothetical protein